MGESKFTSLLNGLAIGAAVVVIVTVFIILVSIIGEKL